MRRTRPHAKGRFVAGGTTSPADNNTPIDRQPSDDYRVAVTELAVPCLETLEHPDFTVAFGKEKVFLTKIKKNTQGWSHFRAGGKGPKKRGPNRVGLIVPWG